ncbi:MAG: hypothetical protein JST51_01555 [Armatimonadetes bacterium]|nr:hypothetical protein [Armatimonadota bacterium]
MNHPQLIEDEKTVPDPTPRSTAYRQMRKYGRFHLLSVWAMWYKCRTAPGWTGSYPKMEALADSITERQYVWRNTYNDEVVVNCLSEMRGPWELVRETEFDTGPSTTRRMMGPVDLIGHSVSPILRGALGDDQLIEILSYLPLTGAYEADRWLAARPDKGHRDPNSTWTSSIGLDLDQKLDMALDSKAVRAALRALEAKAPKAPRDTNPQFKMQDLKKLVSRKSETSHEKVE